MCALSETVGRDVYETSVDHASGLCESRDTKVRLRKRVDEPKGSTKMEVSCKKADRTDEKVQRCFSGVNQMLEIVRLDWSA